MKKYTLLFLLILLSACAGSNPLVDTPSPTGELSGFFSGLFHGFFLFFIFIASLFTDTISIYDVHNIGGWYDFGFFLGVSVMIGGAGGASRY